MSTRKKKFVGSGAWQACKADLITICELIVETMWDPQHLITLCKPPQPLTGIALVFISQDLVEVSGEDMKGKNKRSVGRSVENMLR
jgi:hypothetical protein